MGPALLGDLRSKAIDVKGQKLERQKCFDLLDALTNSGCIDFDDSTLHIVMASTHCFTDSVMDTLVKQNKNPIEKLERSELIVATTIHDKPAEELVVPEQLGRIKEFSSGNLFLEEK